MLRPLRVVVVVLSVCRAMRCCEHAGGIGCRGRPLRCIVSHMRAVFSSKTSSFVSNRSRMSSLRAAVAPSHRARDARAHAAHRRACTLRGACCLLPALWRWCKLRGACGCIAQQYDALHCCDTVLPAFGRGRTLQRAVLRYVCPLPLVVTARCTVALPDVARCICACPQHVAPHGLSVAQYREWHLIVVRILLVSSCCMINSFFPIDTCSSTESPVGPIP